MVRKVALAAVAMTLTACSGGTEPGQEQLLEVAEARVPCVGVDQQQCLVVRSGGSGEWELLYQGIEGFTFEAGYRHRLVVRISTVPDPPADGSSQAYRLVRVQSKTRSARYDDVVALTAAAARWQDAKIAGYTIVQTRHCFCFPRGPVLMEVERAEGSSLFRVASLRYEQDSTAVPAEFRNGFLPIYELFGMLLFAIATDAARADYELRGAIVYPTRAAVDWNAMIADDEVEYVTSLASLTTRE